jgi:hypothetical protein
MLLNEFFGPAIKAGRKQEGADQESDGNTNEVFWYIIDHDRLHKDYFHPLAQKIKHDHENNKLDRADCIRKFMPMVEKGCMEFYHHHKMKQKPGKMFPKEMREDLCERLFDHYCDDIIKDKYKLGN